MVVCMDDGLFRRLGLVKTEVDLTADYRSDTRVVYGLLEMDADTQWVRINRTWLGDGNQIEAAQVRDSSEYPMGSLAVFMEELEPSSTGEITGNEEVLRTWELVEVEVANKELNGIFYGQEQRCLRGHPWHRCVGRKRVVPPAHCLAKWRRGIVGDQAHPIGWRRGQFPACQHPQRVSNAVSQRHRLRAQCEFRMDSPAPGASFLKHDGFMRVNFSEEYYADDAQTMLDSTRDRSLTIQFGTEIVTDDDGVQSLDFMISGERFYTELASRLEENLRIRRVLGTVEPDESKERAFDFVLQIANRDLAVYLDVNEASNSGLQERPLWTNIQGGIGLWGARSTLAVEGVGYQKLSMKYLRESDLTGGLNFCSPRCQRVLLAGIDRVAFQRRPANRILPQGRKVRCRWFT